MSASRKHTFFVRHNPIDRWVDPDKWYGHGSLSRWGYTEEEIEQLDLRCRDCTTCRPFKASR